MNKKIIVSTILVAAMFIVSANAVMAYADPGPASAPVCNTEKPQKAWLYRVKSLGKGKYQLFWDKADKATSWTIGYGTEPGKYIYGIHNFGDEKSRNLIINTFSGKKMYFVVKANNGCMPGEWSNEWKVGTVGTVATGTIKTVAPATKKVTAPVVTKAPAKGTVKDTAPVKETVKETTQETAPVITPAPAKTGGLMNWLKGLFR